MSEESTNQRRIVVAVDESDESVYALSWSINNIIFQNSRDTLILLYVKPPRAIYTPLESTSCVENPESPVDINAVIQKYSQDVADSVIRKFKRMCKDLQNVELQTHVGSGEPKEVICEMSQKLKADLLIMGSRGHGAIRRVFMGSVSSYCSQRVNCPVLIVKKPKTSSGSG